MKCEAIHKKKDEHRICEMCKALGIDNSTYYKWIKRKESRSLKIKEYQELIEKVRIVFEDNKRTYGYRKTHRKLKQKNINISEYKVRKIMRESGMYPETVKKFKPYPNKKSEGKYSDNKLNQKFDVKKPNKVWAGDITYIKTCLGWAYLSVVMDLFNREIIGYSLSKNVDTELVKRALGNALHNKEDEQNIMFHSDRGCQYSSKSYNKMLMDNGIEGSMSRAGCPYDNSCVEGFFSVLKRECIYRRKYSTMEEIERDMFSI